MPVGKDQDGQVDAVEEILDRQVDAVEFVGCGCLLLAAAAILVSVDDAEGGE
jgi:hypothetical protein